METAAAKKAEFARLHDLFQRLANRGSRKARVPAPPKSSRTFVVPTDLALPAVRNLSSVESSKKGQQSVKVVASTGPLRCNTMTATGLTAEEDTVSKGSSESLDKFPVGKSYPFTFKMMLHKLYGLEEWRKKVKAVLEKSWEDYKPLSEVDWEKKRAGIGGGRLGHTTFGLKRQEGRMRSDSTVERARHRSIVLQAAPKICKGDKTGQGDARPIKKRFVGRDKLTTGDPSAGDCGLERRTWVHDSSTALLDADNMGDNGHRARKSSSVPFQLIGPSNGQQGLKYLPPGTPSKISPTSRIIAPRKRALSEADTINSHLSRKRPYLLG